MDREEQLLREWHPGFFKQSDPPHELDTFFPDVVRSKQQQHAVLINEWAKAFLDYHPSPDQRTPEAIKAWSDQIDCSDDDYGKAFAAIACRLAITIAAEEQQKDATINAVRDRIYGRQKASAIYDGDIEKAGRFYRVDQGWHDLLDELVINLSKIPTAGFFSAGQKWGGLKVAFVCDDDFREGVEAVTEIACQKALVTCEVCGLAGEIRKTGWWKVLCDEHQNMRSITEHLRARFPDLVDERTKVNIRASWLKHVWDFCERVEALSAERQLHGTHVRLHDVYERGEQIVIDYDTMPPTVDGHMSVSDPRVLLKIRHIAEEIALDSQLESKT